MISSRDLTATKTFLCDFKLILLLEKSIVEILTSVFPTIVTIYFKGLDLNFKVTNMIKKEIIAIVGNMHDIEGEQVA